MEWWMAGLALSALVGFAARDVGRPGVASAPALLLLRAVGGLGLVAMAAFSLRAGSTPGALVAAVAALPLLTGLTGGLLRPRERGQARVVVPHRTAATAQDDRQRRTA